MAMDTSSDDVMSCLACAVKHVTAAREYYDEFRQNPEYRLEFTRCIGSLACAEIHLLTDNADLASACRELRLMLMEGRLETVQLFNELVLTVCERADLFEDQGGKHGE